MTIAKPERLRLADLTSSVGAVVLGVLAADRLARFGLPLLLIGTLAHAWGIFDKHRLERRADAQEVWWEPLAYWTCWGFLALLAVGLAAGLRDAI